MENILTEGLTFTAHATVTARLTAQEMGSGDLPVYATPAMTALMENAAMNAVAQSLPEGSTTVGGNISVDHLKPSPVGAHIEATARLDKIDGRKLLFTVEARQGDTVIGSGTHLRFIVDSERFMNKIQPQE